jgi:hypothetical protein
VGVVDILVVNHARSGDGRLGDLTAVEIDPFLHENVRAPLLLVPRRLRPSEDAVRAVGRPDDAGRLVAWLCNDDASWMTCQTINSEGGFRCWG